MTSLPRIDEHCVSVDAPADEVWPQIWPVLAAAMGSSAIKRSFASAVGAQERRISGEPYEIGATVTGFRVSEVDPPLRLSLRGAHRFSDYGLDFTVEEQSGNCRLCAITHATFPGVHGQVYKTLVIRSHAHVLVTRRLLNAIKRRAEQPAR